MSLLCFAKAKGSICLAHTGFWLYTAVLYFVALLMQLTVSAYLKSKQLLLTAFTLRFVLVAGRTLLDIGLFHSLK